MVRKKVPIIVDLSFEDSDDDFVPDRRQSSYRMTADDAMAQRLQQEEINNMDLQDVEVMPGLLENEESNDSFVKPAKKVKIKKEKKTQNASFSSSSSTSVAIKEDNSGSNLLQGGDDDAESKDDAIPHYSLGIAPSGRAKCIRCEEVISKGSTRAIVMYPGSMFSSFQHLACTTFHKSVCPPLAEPEHMDGYHMLTPEVQRQVRTRMLESPVEWEAQNAPLNPDALVRKQWGTFYRLQCGRGSVRMWREPHTNLNVIYIAWDRFRHCTKTVPMILFSVLSCTYVFRCVLTIQQDQPYPHVYMPLTHLSIPHPQGA